MRFSFSIILLFCVNHIFGQTLLGSATYKVTKKYELDLDSNQAPAEEDFRMLELLTENSRKDFTLKFSAKTSLYQEVEEIAVDQKPLKIWVMPSHRDLGGTLYKDIETKRTTRQWEFYSKVFLIQDTLQTYDWELINETRKIGEYQCYKAIAYRTELKGHKTIDTSGNKIWMDTIMTEKVVAWYTPSIPISQGPLDLWGLPGLILEARFGENIVLCSQVILNPKKEEKIKGPKKGEVVTMAEFAVIAQAKMEEWKAGMGVNSETKKSTVKPKQ